MKTLFRSLALIVLLSVGSIIAEAQCYYGIGSFYVWSPWGGSYQQGTDLYIDWDIYDLYYGGYWPPIASTVSIDISTDGGSSWTEVATGLDMEEGYPSGYGYFYGYTYVTIPWTLGPSTNCYVRVREVPNSSGDCAYLYDGISYSYYYGQPFTIELGCYQPAVLSQPADQTACVGYPITINPGLDIGPGTPSMQYEWYKNSTLYSTSTSTATLSFSSPQLSDSGSYYLKVKNLCGKEVSTRTMKLTVQAPALFTQQPVGATVCPGTNYTLTANATGTNLRYQWLKDSVAMPGATQNTYVIASATVNDDATYNVIITAACGPSDTSNSAVIIVPEPPVVVQQPVGGGFCPGTNVTISPVIRGTGLSYQWYKGDQMLVGATSVNLNFPSFQPSQSGYYWLKVTGGVGACISTTSTEHVNVYTYGPPVITEQPVAIDVCTNSEGQLVVTAEGTDLIYQWYRNGAPVPNSNSYMLVLNNATSAMSGDYKVDVRSVCNGLATSNTVRVDVLKLPIITTHPVNANLLVGNTLTLTVAASDARIITWYRNDKEIATGSSSTLTINNVATTDAGYYRAIVENVCGSATSRTAKVLVTDPASLVPILEIAAENLNIGDVPYGYNKTETFTNVIMNVGSAPLNVSAISFSGSGASEFVIVGGGAPFTLQPLEARTIDVQFTPGRVGTTLAQMVINSNASPGTRNVSIQGSGVVYYTLASGLNFGDVKVTENKSLCIDVTNTTSTQITIDQVLSNSTDFTVTTSMPLTIGAGATEQVCVTFAPTTVGSLSTTLNFLSSTGGNSSTSASGIGSEPVSVDEDAIAAGMSVYPNPTSGVITINTGNDVARKVTLINLTGETVASITPINSVFSWNLNTATGTSLSSGAYTVRIATERGVYSVRIVVE